MTAISLYVYLVIMYSVHVALAVSPVNAGHFDAAQLPDNFQSR